MSLSKLRHLVVVNHAVNTMFTPVLFLAIDSSSSSGNVFCFIRLCLVDESRVLVEVPHFVVEHRGQGAS